MAKITIPQIRSTALTMLAIFFFAPLFTAWQLQMMNELDIKDWHGFLDFLKHASLSSFWMATGWLFLKSPFAARITELLTSARSVGPDGTETNKSAKVTISEPPSDPASPKSPSPTEESMVRAAKEIMNPPGQPKPPRGK